MKTVVVIEDNEDVAAILDRKLKKSDYEVIRLRDGLEALSYLCDKDKKKPDAVILDLMLPWRSGNDLLNSIHSSLPETKILIYSSHKEYFPVIPKEMVHCTIDKTKGTEVLLRELDAALAL